MICKEVAGHSEVYLLLLPRYFFLLSSQCSQRPRAEMLATQLQDVTFWSLACMQPCYYMHLLINREH